MTRTLRETKGKARSNRKVDIIHSEREYHSQNRGEADRRDQHFLEEEGTSTNASESELQARTLAPNRATRSPNNKG